MSESRSRGIVTMNSAILTILSLLLSFAAYASSGWIGRVDTHMETMEPKVTRMEADITSNARDTERRLLSIEKKIDMLLERRSRE